MFKNIGEKIKTLTLIITITGMFFSVVAGIFFIIIMTDIIDEFAYRVILGALIMIAGSLIFWIGGFTMYGFGELIDRTASIDKKLSVLLRRSNEKKRKETPDPLNEIRQTDNNLQQQF